MESVQGVLKGGVGVAVPAQEVVLYPVVVRVLFPAVFVQVLVQLFVKFLVFFGHARPPISIVLLNVAVSDSPAAFFAGNKG